MGGLGGAQGIRLEQELVNTVQTENTQGTRLEQELVNTGQAENAQGTRLQQGLVNIDQTENVTGWNILNGLRVATLYQNGTMDRLDEQVRPLARDIAGALNTDLDTRAGGTRGDTTGSVPLTRVMTRQRASEPFQGLQVLSLLVLHLKLDIRLAPPLSSALLSLYGAF
ncbi:hypothetical protein KC316_g5385 [Hortaea werneckii]|nr:hypothetical protein KC324_g6286 [Hortaea werneckii]KAI7586807.1 hypothetical protein KC316_g5385 [Hortaea werneckii]